MNNFDQQLEAFQKIYTKRYCLIKYPLEHPYDWPEMDILRYEICGCIAFGLNQAAMTLINHLVESVLKYSLIYRSSIDAGALPEECSHLIIALVNYTNVATKKYSSTSLYTNIEEAFKFGLINENEKQELHGIREVFRNLYCHADKKRLSVRHQFP